MKLTRTIKTHPEDDTPSRVICVLEADEDGISLWTVGTKPEDRRHPLYSADWHTHVMSMLRDALVMADLGDNEP